MREPANPEAPAAAIPRPAATLVLLRDADEGPEVLMLKRHGLSDVLGDAYVFPGGKLDAADLQPSAAGFIDESPAVLQARLGEADCDLRTAVGLFVAAIREACEECGILLAHGLWGSRNSKAATRLGAGESFEQALADLGARLATSQLSPWSRWITPISRLQAKRFDTRFFVARAPSDALPRHDGHEATATAWLRPRQAVELYWAGDINLAPPQIMTLAELSRYDSVTTILASARGRPPYLVQPHVLESSQGLMLCFPGDVAHSVRGRAMPGPLRMAIRNDRYEPLEGFEALFA